VAVDTGLVDHPVGDGNAHQGLAVDFLGAAENRVGVFAEGAPGFAAEVIHLAVFAIGEREGRVKANGDALFCEQAAEVMDHGCRQGDAVGVGLVIDGRGNVICAGDFLDHVLGVIGTQCLELLHGGLGLGNGLLLGILAHHIGDHQCQGNDADGENQADWREQLPEQGFLHDMNPRVN